MHVLLFLGFEFFGQLKYLLLKFLYLNLVLIIANILSFYVFVDNFGLSNNSTSLLLSQLLLLFEFIFKQHDITIIIGTFFQQNLLFIVPLTLLILISFFQYSHPTFQTFIFFLQLLTSVSHFIQLLDQLFVFLLSSLFIFFLISIVMVDW